MRVWVVGFGTVGRWLISALATSREELAMRYGVAPTVVGLANARDGFVYAANGLHLDVVLETAERGSSVAELPGVERHPTALAGLRATDADLLVEVTGSPETDAEPGLSHIREAIGRGIPVATSNKWPVALHGVELAATAAAHGCELRAESTVMSGTPVLATLTEGLAGAVPTSIRSVLNATANFVLDRIDDGLTYERALAEAQAGGLAERDPAADVEGRDTAAKLMILAALVFGVQLRLEDVARRGIASIAPAEYEEAARSGRRIREVATLERLPSGSVEATVEPALLDADDPLARVEGTQNAIVCAAAPLGEVTIAGPGAGPELAGQGVLSDVIALARR